MEKRSEGPVYAVERRAMRERATVFSLRLDPESRAVVKQEAMRQRVTESTIIRKAIERYVYWCIQERTAGRLP